MNKSLKYELVYICVIFCLNMLNLSFTRERMSSLFEFILCCVHLAVHYQKSSKETIYQYGSSFEATLREVLSYYFLLFYQIEVQ